MKCCVSTDVGTWTNWLTFEPDLDYSPDAETGLLSPPSYKSWYAEFYVGENPTYTYWPLQQRVVLKLFYSPPLQRRVVLQWFYSLSRRNTVNTFVRGTCALPSALLILYLISWVNCWSPVTHACHCMAAATDKSVVKPSHVTQGIFMPDAVSPTTFHISGLADRLRTCWPAYPEARLASEQHILNFSRQFVEYFDHTATPYRQKH